MCRSKVPLVLLFTLGVCEAFGFFHGCMVTLPYGGVPGCVFVNPDWLHSEAYRKFGHMAVGNYSLDHRECERLNTLLRVTDAANHVSSQILRRQAGDPSRGLFIQRLRIP